MTEVVDDDWEFRPQKKILELKLAGRPTAAKLELAKLARATDGYSGADLDAVVAAATEFAIDSALERSSEVPIDDADLLRRRLDDLVTTFEEKLSPERAEQSCLADEQLAELNGLAGAKPSVFARKLTR